MHKTFFKQKPFRSEEYLALVRALPSAISSRPAVDAHHIKRPGFGGTVKCSDLWTIPLTREEHIEFHTIGWEAWEEKYVVDQRELAMQTLEKLITEWIDGE